MIWLIFAHFIGDIALQSDWQAQNKGKYWYVMLSHCMIWSACICVALEYQVNFSHKLPIVLFLVFGHGVSDTIKSKLPKSPETWWHIYPDQIWHIIQLYLVYTAFQWI